MFIVNLIIKDVDYYIRVWMDDINLLTTNHAYNSLGTIKGIIPLDEIKVTVKGSLYDDTN